MKKSILLAINLLLLILVVMIIVFAFKDKANNDIKFSNTSDGRIKIITTLFPEYDFVRQVVADKADVELILKSGVETHNFEPTAIDILKINSSDLFFSLGEELEPWTKEIANSIENKDKIVDMSANVNIMEKDALDKNHEKHSHDHEESLDSHIWLSITNAKIMIDTVVENVSKIDPENAEFYKTNAENYKKEIDKIDAEFKEIFKDKNITLAFGGEFAYAYFVNEYDVDFISVYTNCGHGEDPSILKVKSVIDEINNKKIPVVFYNELSEGLVAKMISEETEADALVLYTIHNGNILGDKLDTYVSLMNKNLENIKKAIKTN